MTREQNARIAALREDNYEEYLKLAANTKNQRLRTLLEKTGNIIEELGLKVCFPSSPSICLYASHVAAVIDTMLAGKRYQLMSHKSVCAPECPYLPPMLVFAGQNVTWLLLLPF